MVRENNGAGATGFVVTNQVGRRMDRNIFEKNGNDGNIFVVAFKKHLSGRSWHSQTCDLNQTVGAMTDESVVLGGGVGGGVKDGGSGRVFFSLV